MIGWHSTSVGRGRRRAIDYGCGVTSGVSGSSAGASFSGSSGGSPRLARSSSEEKQVIQSKSICVQSRRVDDHAARRFFLCTSWILEVFAGFPGLGLGAFFFASSMRSGWDSFPHATPGSAPHSGHFTSVSDMGNLRQGRFCPKGERLYGQLRSGKKGHSIP